MTNQLHLRDDQRRDIITRSFQMRAATVNEQARTVEAVIATDAPVQVYDWGRGEIIDEVLRADGCQIPGQMPMLANHDRWSLDSVLGSIRAMRSEGGNIVGTLHFARDDQAADAAWNKVRQGHLIDVSVGYRVNEGTEVAPGQTATVNGRQYTAGVRTLRIDTSWTPKEASLVPIGADQAAKIREDVTLFSPKETATMRPELRAYLQSIGLRADASEADANAFLARLTGEQSARAEALANPASPASPGTPATPPASPPAPAATPARSEGGQSDPDAVAVARAAVVAERDRVRQIRELAGADVPEAVRDQAIDEGWDVNRSSREFLTAVRSHRPSMGPAIHSHSRELDTNRASLAANLLMEYGGVDRTRAVGRRLTNGQSRIQSAGVITEQHVEAGMRIGALSATDVIRLCAQADTGRWIMDPEEAMRAAVSGGTLAYVFTTSMYAKLLQGWEEVTDTTTWCDEEDVPNFLSQEDISLDVSSNLQRLPRGGTANDASLSDSRETYKIARYAKKFSVDEMDQIDDRLGATMNMPVEMGRAARRLRPDLVYALLLANATLADTGALFNATAVTTAGGHANLTTAVLGATGLKAAILAMGAYRNAGGAVLNIRPRYLIVPAALQWTAKELLTSIAQAYTAAAAAATPSLYYPINVLVGENLTLVIDDRIGAAGVTDPTTGTARTGLATNWFFSAGGQRTVRVAYRRGTGRAPQMRSYILDRGQWGMGWDINMDIGAKALDYRGMHKSAGTG